MTAEQPEVRKIVIETPLVQANDVRISAKVIFVASPAVLSVFLCKKTVKSGLVANVARNVFVAGKAKFGLPVPIERDVAGAALSFDVRMTLDDLAWHDQCFDLGMSVGGGDCCEHQY